MHIKLLGSRAHYPAEFLAANMNTEMNDIERIVVLINEAKENNIEVDAPDINVSFPNLELLAEKRLVLVCLL